MDDATTAGALASTVSAAWQLAWDDAALFVETSDDVVEELLGLLVHLRERRELGESSRQIVEVHVLTPSDLGEKLINARFEVGSGLRHERTSQVSALPSSPLLGERMCFGKWGARGAQRAKSFVRRGLA